MKSQEPLMQTWLNTVPHVITSQTTLWERGMSVLACDACLYPEPVHKNLGVWRKWITRYLTVLCSSAAMGHQHWWHNRFHILMSWREISPAISAELSTRFERNASQKMNQPAVPTLSEDADFPHLPLKGH